MIRSDSDVTIICAPIGIAAGYLTGCPDRRWYPSRTWCKFLPWYHRDEVANYRCPISQPTDLECIGLAA